MSSSDTIILITGANSGVGYATAQVLASTSNDYHVYLAGRNFSALEDAAAEIRSAPETIGTVRIIQLDLNDPDSISAAVRYINIQHGRLDVLINNAGVHVQGPDLATELRQDFETNVVGTTVVTYAFEQLLLASRKAYLLFISSGLGSIAGAADPSDPYYRIDGLGYRISKAGLNMLTVQTVKKLGGQGVKVFAVCPGLVVSNLRGKGEEARSAGGYAGDPMVSGQTVLGILRGERDGEVGKFVHKDGVYPW